MLDFETFKSKIRGLDIVKSSTSSTEYYIENVTVTHVEFKRKDKTKEEKISLEKLYDFYLHEPNKNTKTAKEYGLGGVQSPAYAILLALENMA